jgi:hypothetical protein
MHRRRGTNGNKPQWNKRDAPHGDLYLYQAKDNGRNRVECDENPSAEAGIK